MIELDHQLGIDAVSLGATPADLSLYWERLAWCLMKRHVPAFRYAVSTELPSRTITQSGTLGASPAIQTDVACSIEWYRRVVIDQNRCISLPDLAKSIHCMLTQFAEKGALTAKSGYRQTVPARKTVLRYLTKMNTAFDDVLSGDGTWDQCEYVEYVCPTVDRDMDKKFPTAGQ